MPMTNSTIWPLLRRAASVWALRLTARRTRVARERHNDFMIAPLKMMLDVLGTRTRASAPHELGDFQRSGGPRSVSGDPMEEKTITAGARNETSPSRFSSGRERFVAEKRANCNCTKIRRPHLLAAGGLMDLPAFSLAQSRSARQAVFAGWPSHPATHAGVKPKMERTTTRAEQQRTVLVRR